MGKLKYLLSGAIGALGIASIGAAQADVVSLTVWGGNTTNTADLTPNNSGADRGAANPVRTNMPTATFNWTNATPGILVGLASLGFAVSRPPRKRRPVALFSESENGGLTSRLLSDTTA
jgi:hypothetical protein